MNRYMRILMAVVIGFTLGSSSTGFGMSCHSDKNSGHAAASQAPKSAKPAKAIDVGNKICPVLGEPINDVTKATYKYKGKIYNFCCAGCIKTFKKEPQKYIDKVKQELQAAQGAK